MPMPRATLPLLIALFLSSFADAQSTGKSDTRPATQPATQPAADQRLWNRLAVTEHELKLGEQVLKYKATAGYMTLRNQDEQKDKADLFFVAYEKTGDGERSPGERPLTFVFNGGPGAAAVWLHLGTAGPKRVKMGNEAGEPPAPPYELVDNDQTWLDLTDLVFIDPVGTGFSRAVAGEKPEQFFGVREDVSWMAEFIRLYTTRYERWASPKFLAGESYGTTRAAALSDYLGDRVGIALNGIILVSVVLDFQTIRVDPANNLPFVLFLPTYTATAAYHKKLPPELQADPAKAKKEVERFAVGEYLSALAKGTAIDAGERKAVADQLARYTGLPPSLIEKANLRIDPSLFRDALLEDRRQIIGRFDARIKGFDANPVQPYPEYDPSFPAYFAAYGSAMSDYARRVLRFESDLQYEVLSPKVRPWNFGQGNDGYLNVADDLRQAMVKNPFLKVLFASGYYDLATPYFASDYTVNHLNLGPDLRKNVSQTYYTAGHMMYHELESLRKLKADVRAFVESALPPRKK